MRTPTPAESNSCQSMVCAAPPFVHAGVVELRYQDDLVTLETGDCAYFDASLPHQLRQRGSTPSEVLVITHTEYGRNR